MRRTTTLRIATAGLAAGFFLAVGLAPAGANGNGPDDKGAPAHAAAPTEDTDTNDNGTPNNVADDGDNAHPSGNDRSIEHGRSGNQGRAQADPDDDTRGPERTNGSADQPDGPGGVDAADQDGNNGCGNDDDFEDDNEGHCRRGAAAAGSAVTPGARSCSNGSTGQGGSCGGNSSAPNGNAIGDAGNHDATVSGSNADNAGGNGPADAPGRSGTRGPADGASTPAVEDADAAVAATGHVGSADAIAAIVCGAIAACGDTDTTDVAPPTGGDDDARPADADVDARPAGDDVVVAQVHAVSAGSAVLATIGNGVSAAVGGGAGALAFTGLDLTKLTGIAVLMIGLGIVLRARGVRRSA